MGVFFPEPNNQDISHELHTTEAQREGATSRDKDTLGLVLTITPCVCSVYSRVSRVVFSGMNSGIIRQRCAREFHAIICLHVEQVYAGNRRCLRTQLDENYGKTDSISIMSGPPLDEDYGKTDSISIPVRGSSAVVEVYTDDLPGDYNDVVDVLKAEIAPLDIWLRFAVSHGTYV